MPQRFEVRPATVAEHATLLKLAKTSPHTKDFGNHIFSGEQHYAKGWIRVLLQHGKVVGFTCFRHKVRTSETKLYFLVVDPSLRGRGLGKRLMLDLESCCAARTIRLDCAKSNPACAFYRALGYTEEGDSLEGTALRFVKSW